MHKRIWITWENQRRNQTLSVALGAELFQFDFKTNKLWRYLKSSFLTIVTFVTKCPSVIFVQNPSLVLAFLAVSYGRVVNVPVIVDAHNAGVFPFKDETWLGSKITDYLFKYSFLTIVTNEALSDFIKKRGGRTVILPDPLPEFDKDTAPMALKGRANVLFICSFANDEPYMEVIEAGRLLNRDTVIYVTGRYKGDINELKEKMPENVVLTGYIPENYFVRILHSVDIVIDLTTRENCLVCGAYEAVAAEKVLIVSATKALMQYFHKGTLYAQNNRVDIARQIEQALQSKRYLVNEIKELKKEKMKEWVHKKAELDSKLKLLF